MSKNAMRTRRSTWNARIGVLALTCGLPLAAQASNPIWINPMTCGAPIATYYLGDSLGSPYYVNFEIGQTSWNYAQVGYGTSSAGSSFNWGVANWYEDGSGSNKRVRRDIGGLKFTATGSWYLICQAKESSGDTYTSAAGCGWVNTTAYPPSSMNNYFTVSALTAPSGQTASRNSTNSIDLSWTRGVSGGSTKDTLIIKRAGSDVATDPTQGTAYNAGDSIGSGTVLYRGSATSLVDTNVTAGTTYYYKFYAENYSYYSASASANVATRPTDATWDGGGADNNWQTEANWDNNLYPYAGANTAILRFSGSTKTSATNNYTAGTTFNEVRFASGAAASFTLAGNAFVIKSKIENDTGASYSHTISNNITGASQAFEINPVGGNLTLGGTVNNNGQTVNFYGNTAKTAFLNGVVSGAGALTVKDNTVVVLTNANTFSGGLNVWAGTVNLIGSTNAMGLGTVNVGTNATLDLQYGAATLNTVPMYLYGTGTNASWGALRKTTSGTISLRSTITLGAHSRIVVTGGGMNIYSNIAAGAFTLYLTNEINVTMQSGSTMAGTLTTGDGALRKTGMRTFTLRPSSGLTGSIFLDQGEIRQTTDNSDTLPAGGALTLAGGTGYGSDAAGSRIVAKNVVINGGVGLATNSTGGLTLSGTVSLGSGTRVITNVNTLTISGVISSGGLEKKGAGTMILTAANDYASGTTVTEGTLQIGNNGTTGSVINNIVNNAALVWYRSDSPTYTGQISGTGTLAKQGAGTVTLSGTSSMNGATTISAGGLLVSGSMGSSAITVASGATLSGAGTVGSIASLAGTVSPGNSAGVAGTLNVTGAAALGGGTYTCDITGLGTTDCDKIAAGGAVAAASALTINLPGSAPGSFNENTSYSWTVMSGSTASAANMSIGTKWSASGTFGVTAVGGNTIVVTYTAPAPATPANLLASDGTSTAHVALSWDNVTGETGFVIWRHTANVFGSAGAIFTNAADTLTYNDASASAGTRYYYWVTATNTTGSSAESTSNSGYKRLAAPGNLAATDGSSTANIAVTWDAVTGASAYYLYRDTDSDPAGSTALGEQTSGYTDTPTAGQLYYYWAMASNTSSSSTSDWSTVNTGYRKLSAVAGVAATENLSDKVTVTWTDSNAGETGYTVWRSDDSDSGNAAIISGAALGANVVTYDDATATAGQTYYYWVRATNSTSASLSDFGSADTGMKTLTEPTIQASNVVFSSLGTVSYTVGWSRGNGEYVLVVAKQGSAPTAPSDSTVYDADAAFGSGDTTAAGSYVVYKGTGTSVPVTALSAGTEYYFAAYEFNGAATPNYIVSSAVNNPSNRYTLAAEPTTQASSISVTGTNMVTLTGINWTDGNGASRLVVVKAGAAVDSFPVDGSTYTANATFGSGTQIGTGNYVVHAGSGPLATLSGLTPDVIYHFRVFEFNGTLGTTANFLTDTASGNPISSTTMAVNPGSAASDLTINSIGTNQFTITWTKGTTGTNTLILVKASAVTDPTDLTTYTANTVYGGSTTANGDSVVYTGTGSSVTVTGLTPGQRYYVRAYAFNGSNGSQNYRTSDEPSTDAYTLMGEPSQATSITFGTLANTSYAVSYTAGGGVSRLVVAKAGSAVDWTPTDGTAYSGENNAFGSGTELSAGNFLVHRGASPFTLSGLSAATDYHIRIFEYQGTNTTINYNVNAAASNPSNRYTLSAEPTAHGTLTATAVSDTEIDLDWGDATGESGFVILRRSGAAPTGVPADGTAYTAGNTIGDGTVVYAGTAAGAGSTTDSSLSAGTTYYYKIFPYAYDGTAGHATYNYYTGGTPGNDSDTTGSAEPASSSTITSFLPASGSSATLIWDNSGSADGTIILVKSNAAVSTAPSDWNGYTANTAFSSGDQIGTGNYVVYAAAGKSGSVTITGLSAGYTYHAAVYPYNGSGAFLNYRTTSPATNSVVILPDPSAGTATADGKTLIDLAWTKNASYDVMIVYKSGSASTAPTQGSAYSVGGACGGGTVIYKGSGSALEHIVASGTTHYYAFYSYSGNYYSAGLTDSEATTAFASGEVTETFSYTNSIVLTGMNGETGWGWQWYGDTGSFTNHSGSFSAQANYPTPSGNKLRTYPPNDTSVAVYRPLNQDYKSGRIYFGYILNYLWNGANKYAGLSLMYSNTSEKLFFGEIYAADQQLGIDSTGSSTALTAGSGNDYIIVGYYDWGTGTAYANAYKIGTDTVPTDEPTSWNVTKSKSSNDVGWVNTVRLAAGAGSSAGTPGTTYFDEVRIATNWSDLLGVVPSKPLDPSSQTATVDGSEMVRLAWTKNGAGNGVMILHHTNTISTEPTDGVSYGAGDSVGSAKVIYKSSGTALEHVVVPGTTNYYKFYSYNSASYYSTGVTATVTNNAYSAAERVNPFSYTNGISPGTTTKGGQGFGDNYWSVDSGTWAVRTNYSTAVTDDTPKFMNLSNYPAMAGNLIYSDITSDGGVAKAQRSLASTISTGQFYIAFMMAYQHWGPNKWAGLSLLNSSGTEKAFLGKGAGANYSTLAIADGSTTYWSAYDLGQFNASHGDTGNVYLVVGKYNFDNDLFQAKAYRILDTAEFPSSEPSWDVSQTMTGVDNISRIQLNAGALSSYGYPGKVFYDEIRYATDWSGLIATVCPTWAGSNMLNDAAWTASSNVWLGDSHAFQFQSYPPGPGQSGSIAIDWGRNGAYTSTYSMTWWKNANNNTYWTNMVQMTGAGTITSRYVAAGNNCSGVTTNNRTLVVQNLNAPSNTTAAQDSVNTNSQINLAWNRGVSGVAKDTLIVRKTANSGWTAPANGSTYNAGDSVGDGIVVYRGAGTNYNDTGLAPSTTYYYRFYAENYTYYSTAYATNYAATTAGGQNIVVDGATADWVGTPSAVLDTSASSLQEFIWTDKKGEVRNEHGDHPNGDISEFRVFADATNVYFLIKMTNITDIVKPFVAIGIDTRTNSGSTSMNWIGDDSGTFIGDGYAQGGAAHFPERQLNIHYVSADGAARIEMYKSDGTSWNAPDTGGNTNVVIHAGNKAIELMVPRADLNLTGAKTARFTVAAFLNTGSWNNDGDATTHIADNTAAAIDALSIPPWSTADNAANLSAWLEDISDQDIDFWMDVKFGASGLTDNVKPATVTLVSPTNTAYVTASPNLCWTPSSDSDGQVTGYLLEISTNDQFNGVTGTENGTVDLRVHLAASTTNYTFTTSATQYWWRVRARDTAGQLSTATTHWFKVVGKLDTEGPQPTLLYIGTNVAGYLAGQYDAHIAKYGYIQSVLDSEIRDTNNVFGFVLRWEDSSGVYATNMAHANLSGGPGAGAFAFNIVDENGRVSPNWDLVEINTTAGTTNEWGKDLPFYASNTLATGNSDTIMTNYVHAAFTITNYNPAIEYYLTISAEDAYTTDGSWWNYGSWASYTNNSGGKYFSGWCSDGPSTVRNITTNYLIRIQVTDDDLIAPVATTNAGWSNSGTNVALVISNATARLGFVTGTGQEALYQMTDAAPLGGPLSFGFNAYDSYYKGIAYGTGQIYTNSGRILTNSSFVVTNWQTNWANFDASRSVVADTTDGGTMLTWRWASISKTDVTALWGPGGFSNAFSQTNLVQLDLFDVDNDRDGDQSSGRVTFGRLVLADDDAADPVVDDANLKVTGTGLAKEYVLANLVEWDFLNGISSLTSTNVASNVVASALSHGGSGGTVNLQDASSGVPSPQALYTGAPYYNTNNYRYFLFTVAPDVTTKTIRASSISFDSRVTSLNGPDTLELWGTMPGGSETLWATNAIDLSDPDSSVGTNWNGYSMSVAMPAATTGTVTFKLVARVTDTNHLVSGQNANWYLDNLILSGYTLSSAGGTQITDNDLSKGTAQFALSAYDVYSGLDMTTGSTTGRAPRVDFWNNSQSVCPVTNAYITNGLTSATGSTPMAISQYAPAAADKRQVALGSGGASLTYYARYTVNDADTDRDSDSRNVIYTTTNTVYDEDSSKPTRGYLFGGPLGVYVEGALTKAVSSGNNREYRINDEQLQLATSTSIAVKVNLYDYSGWSVPTLSVSNSSQGVMSTNGWLTAVATDTVNTTNIPDATMEWRFSTTQASTLFSTSEGLSNEFQVVSVWDKDDDRLDASSNNNDNLELANARIGYLTFIDNDVGQANVLNSYSAAKTNWNIPKVFWGLPGDSGSSNLYLSGLADGPTNQQRTVLADLTNRIYDSQLAKVSAAVPLSVVLPLYDTPGGGAGRTTKGVMRGTSLTESSTNGGVHTITNTSINIGTVRVQNASAYRSDMSSSLALTKIAAQAPTSTWAFTSFSYSEVGAWLPPAAASSNHVMTATILDADDNRAADQKIRESVALGSLLVLDNDSVAPVPPTNVTVNGVATTGDLNRATAAWTNQPEFLVRFEPAVDGTPAATDLEKSGIGEYRTATAKAGIGPDLGTPMAVPAEGALANYGFEKGSAPWTLSGAEVSTEQAYEGTNSLKMTGSTAQQTVPLFNTNGYSPRVAVLGAQFMGNAVTGTVTITGLDSGGTPVGGAMFSVPIVGTNGQWVAAIATSNTLAATVDQVRVTLTSTASTYWDDIQVQIELLNSGTPIDEASALFTATEQGLTTNYLFAVDRDNNRAGDRKASSTPTDEAIPAFGIAYDITPPTAVPLPDDAASTELVPDPTTQFDIHWNAGTVGPDDEGHDDYPAGYSGNDVLSPWKSYKVYYGTFDPMQVPGGDPGHGSGSAFIYTNFIQTGAYSNWACIVSTNTIADPSAGGTNYLALTNRGQASVRLFDLDFDQDYAVVVVGVDKAGNEGPATPSSWATNNTIKFAVTQGVLKARAAVLNAFPTNNNLEAADKSAAALFWIAAGQSNGQGTVTKDYDLIYWDAGSFEETSNSTWQKVGTIHSNWFADARGQDYSRGTVRFYRASYKDRWQRNDPQTGQPRLPLASEDVYALHNVILSEGYNFVGLHGEPYTNTFAGVFGADTNIWPAGASPAAGATKIEFYSAGTNAPVSSAYFIGTDGNWYLSGGGPTPVTTNLQASNFFTRGFTITLPKPLPAFYATTTAQDVNYPGSNVAAMVWHPVLKVPTNGPGGGAYSHTIACGYKLGGRTNVYVYNVVSLNLPVSVHPSELNLPINFVRGAYNVADQIYTINTATKGVMGGRTIYCDAGGTWRFMPGDGNPAPGAAVTGDFFKPNDVIVIVSCNGGQGNSWTWTYHPTNFYSPPTRWMGQ